MNPDTTEGDTPPDDVGGRDVGGRDVDGIDGPARWRRRLGVLAIGLAVIVIVAFSVVFGGERQSADDKATVAATGGGRQTVSVKLIDLDIVPGQITVSPGSQLVLNVTNAGGMRHDLAFPNGPATRMLDPGESQRLDLGTITTSRTGWCTVPGHKEAGMTLTINVTDGKAAADGHASTQGHASAEGHGSATGHDATPVPGATPGPDFRPYPATLPPAGPRTQHVTLRVSDQTLHVAPGVTQRMWTFGGTVPGPTLHGRVGDTFEVTLINDTSMDHSIDFHAGIVAPDGPMRTIGPGEQLIYRFTADHAGAWMYHCATEPMIHHVGNGMYGAVIIDPPDLAPVSAEYALVQSELYLGAQGEPGDAAKMARGTPDMVVFNGYFDQYRYAPLSAQAGDRVRIWIVNAGLDRPSAFHVVGTQFDTVFSEGAYLVRPDNPAHGAAQAFSLLPGQGGFVEFTVPAAGHYPFLSHLMVDAARGASGMLTVTG